MTAARNYFPHFLVVAEPPARPSACLPNSVVGNYANHEGEEAPNEAAFILAGAIPAPLEEAAAPARCRVA